MSSASIRNAAILTSGGDAPGMNACVRAATHVFEAAGVSVFGIRDGYRGLVDDRIKPIACREVDLLVSRGGTCLGTARCPEFHEADARTVAAQNLKKRDIDALVIIGGDGSMRGAEALMREHGVSVAGVPGTIDCDILGTDETIGFDTALGISVDAIDRLRDTAESHHRIFIVEVMGRDSSALAVSVGIAGGADIIVAPDWKTEPDRIVAHLRKNTEHLASSVVVVAEGDECGGASALRELVAPRVPGAEVRATVLGHIQRGGSPSPRDRILGAMLGVDAAEGLIQGSSGFLSGVRGGEVNRVALSDVVGGNAIVGARLAPLARHLSFLM